MCLNMDCRKELESCPVPIHASAFSEDLQTPLSMVSIVSDCTMNGNFNKIGGLGHVSLARHQPDAVNTLINKVLSQDR